MCIKYAYKIQIYVFIDKYLQPLILKPKLG